MSNIAAAIEDVKALIGERLDQSQAQRDIHGANEAYFPPMPPDAVAYPKTTQEVSDIVKACAKHGCPIVPWGVGTSLEGHALALKGGITLNMSEMNEIVETRPEDLLARVQPGLTRESLNEELRATGLFFPIDPGANATLGGMTATRASGTTAVRYGTMKDNVRALEVVLADGRIIRTGSAAKKSSAGYDLTRLFVGSEGTLGIITEITLELQGQPDSIAAAICEFPDIHSAVSAVITAIQMGIPMARVELVDALLMRTMNHYSDLGYPESPHLFMEFHGTALEVKEQSTLMGEIAQDCGGAAFQWSTKTEERSRLWAARHNAYFAIKSYFSGLEGMTTDICVPISQLATAIAQTQEDLAQHGLEAPILGHVGDGNYHTTLMSHPDRPEELERNKALANRMAERAIKLGGTVTGEHGIGMGKMKFMEAEHGDAWQVMAELKKSFDPKNILNPGKLVQIN